MERRDFLKKAGIFTTGTLFARQPVAQAGTEALEKNGTVLILGAGLSGLSAAYYLHQKGIEVTLLEARNRISGRVFTHFADLASGLYTELGAEWIGASHKTLLALCHELELKLIDHTFQNNFSLQNKYETHDTLPEDAAWEQKLQTLLNGFTRLPEKELRNLDKLSWWRYLVNQGIPDKALERRELSDSTDFGETIRSVSAFAAFSEYAESSANNEMDFKVEGGNALIAKALADKIGLDKIQLGKKAIKVSQTGKEVTVFCEDGTRYTASRLICTLPAFAASRLNWNPTLPAEKAEALQQLQYGRIMKTSVLFSERFWQDEAFGVTTDSLAHFIYHNSQHQPGPKGLLTAYTTGDKAFVFSKLNPEQKIREVCQALQPAFGDTERFAEKVTGYYWGEDVFSMGAYAVYNTGQWYGIRAALGKPFQKVVFTGEHLAEWQGFMEGAVQTGLDAAKALAG